MTINKAYDLIRKAELGEDEDKPKRKLTAGQVKMLNALYRSGNSDGIGSIWRRPAFASR